MVRFIDELRREPILLAHHPLCGRFEDHMIRVKGRRLCRGCLTVYPSALIVLPLLWLIGAPFPTYLALAIGLFSAQLPRFYLPSGRSALLLNILLGASLASIIMALATCPPELRPAVYPPVLAVAVAFLYIKGRRVFRTCRGCPRSGEFPRCAR